MCKMDSFPYNETKETVIEQNIEPTKEEHNNFHYKICYQIAFSEYFEKIKDDTTGEFFYKCRRHGWVEGNAGYTYYPQCPDCSEYIEERTYEIMIYSKSEKHKEMYKKPGSKQIQVEKKELEEFWNYMEELYPFPEEFL